MGAYYDYLQSAQLERPNCWGNPRSYDPHEEECAGCRFLRSCAAAVERAQPTSQTHSQQAQPVRVNYTPSQPPPVPRRDEDIAGRYTPAQIAPGEKPFERFLKDAIAGALRGAFWEMYQFWKYFRF